jgi:kynurenine formamidase
MSIIKQFIDLSHTVEHGLITYRGLPAPVICDFLSREQSRAYYAPGTEFQIGKIEMVANTGTYLDSPFHRFPDGADLSQLELASLADLDGVVIRHIKRKDARLARQYFPASTLRGKRCWCRHDGMSTGRPKRISTGIHF